MKVASLVCDWPVKRGRHPGKCGQAAEERLVSVTTRVYRPDLCAEHTKALNDQVSELVVDQTRDARTPSKRAPRKKPDYNVEEVRAWAKANDFAVSNRGRIAKKILDAYHAREGAQEAPSEPQQESSAA